MNSNCNSKQFAQQQAFQTIKHVSGFEQISYFYFQIECSSIIDYSEKIVKANRLDHSKCWWSFVCLCFNTVWLKILQLICVIAVFFVCVF